MARTPDYYDPSGLWPKDYKQLRPRWRTREQHEHGEYGRTKNTNQLVRLLPAYIRIQEPGSDRRHLVGYVSPVTLKLWQVDELRETWLALMILCGFAADPDEPEAWRPLSWEAAGQPEAYYASRCLWKKEGAAMLREEQKLEL